MHDMQMKSAQIDPSIWSPENIITSIELISQWKRPETKTENLRREPGVESFVTSKLLHQ